MTRRINRFFLLAIFIMVCGIGLQTAYSQTSPSELVCPALWNVPYYQEYQEVDPDRFQRFQQDINEWYATRQRENKPLADCLCEVEIEFSNQLPIPENGFPVGDDGGPADPFLDQGDLARAQQAGVQQCETQHVDPTPPPQPAPEPAPLHELEAAEQESALSAATEASAYYARTVTNRIRLLRPAGGANFASSGGPQGGPLLMLSGLNAGEHTLPAYPPNLSIDVGHSRTRVPGRFETQSNYLLGLTDRLLNPQLLLGYGFGAEHARESLLGGSSTKRSLGLTATLYLAQIMNEHLTFVPQAALTLLSKQQNSVTTPNTDTRAARGLLSMSMLVQDRIGSIELSGVGQLAFTHESPETGDSIYLAQAIASGEIAWVAEGFRPFLGVASDFDITSSTGSTIGGNTDDPYGWEATAGARFTLNPSTVFSLSVSTGRKDTERTTRANVFMRFTF